ncbi:MAG TPA: hypothetical protein VFL72_05455 [Acidimicrobiia bacterium]|nr:hypothetical protein [Acidimicrobiia bacterium]
MLESTVSDSVLQGLQVVAKKNLIDATRADILESITISVVQSIREVTGGLDSSTEHLGGEDVTGCTSGFGTKTSSGVRGISTAGHCNNSQTDDGASLTIQSAHEGTHGDFQWHTGPQAEGDDFYSGSTSSTEVTRRDVSSIGAPTVGQSLCRNGVTSHKDCQNVRKVNVCNLGVCNLVQMDTDLSAGGDSGGPVYFGNTAYGLHQGWMLDLSPRDLFSRADRMDNAMPTSVATS